MSEFNLTTPKLLDNNEKYRDYLIEYGLSIISPEKLEQLLNGNSEEFPLIFYKGNLDLLNKRCVSVVGTRNPSPEGVRRAKKVAAILVNNDFVVISGLAKGIDKAAHEACIEYDRETISVLGTPLHKVYPAAHRGLFKDIVKKGLVISPSKPHETWGRYLFPRRNRLMAQLMEAIIVIEAGKTSGVKHQAAECLKRNKKLFFLKSMVNKENESWVNSFLKSGGKLIGSPDGMLEKLNEK